jgi:PEP-CTERM motif
MITRSAIAVVLLLTLLNVATTPARATLFSLAASGTISENSSGDSTISIGTPWTFELRYDTAAPDLDFELTGSPDPTFGRFTNTATPPALTFFHYRAGGYEVTLGDPAGFGTFSDLLITFTSINGIDINIHAPTFFPPLAGGPVSFHADFAAFSSPPIFTSDALPTNTALDPGSFVDSNVTLLPPAGVVSSNSLTSLTLTAVLPGDFNTDGTVDAADYVVWRENEGTTNSLPNDNGIGGTVGQAQYDLWRVQFGESVPGGAGASATAAVPEPATYLLLIAAAAGAWTRRRGIQFVV